MLLKQQRKMSSDKRQRTFTFPPDVFKHKHKIKFLRPYPIRTKPKTIKKNSITFVDLYNTRMPTESDKSTNGSHLVSQNNDDHEILHDKFASYIHGTSHAVRAGKQEASKDNFANNNSITSQDQMIVSREKTAQHDPESPRSHDTLQVRTTNGTGVTLQDQTHNNTSESFQTKRKADHPIISQDRTTTNDFQSLPDKLTNTIHGISRDKISDDCNNSQSKSASISHLTFNDLPFSKNSSEHNIRSRVLLANLHRAKDSHVYSRDNRIFFMKDTGGETCGSASKISAVETSFETSRAASKNAMQSIPYPPFLHSEKPADRVRVKIEDGLISNNDETSAIAVERSRHSSIGNSGIPLSPAALFRQFRPPERELYKTAAREASSISGGMFSPQGHIATNELKSRDGRICSSYRPGQNEHGLNLGERSAETGPSLIAPIPISPWKRQLAHSLTYLHQSQPGIRYTTPARNFNGETDRLRIQNNGSMHGDRMHNMDHSYRDDRGRDDADRNREGRDVCRKYTQKDREQRFLGRENVGTGHRDIGREPMGRVQMGREQMGKEQMGRGREQMDGGREQIDGGREHIDRSREGRNRHDDYRERDQDNRIQYFYPDKQTTVYNPTASTEIKDAIDRYRVGSFYSDSSSVLGKDDAARYVPGIMSRPEPKPKKNPPLLLKNKAVTGIKYFNYGAEPDNNRLHSDRDSLRQPRDNFIVLEHGPNSPRGDLSKRDAGFRVEPPGVHQNDRHLVGQSASVVPRLIASSARSANRQPEQTCDNEILPSATIRYTQQQQQQQQQREPKRMFNQYTLSKALSDQYNGPKAVPDSNMQATRPAASAKNHIIVTYGYNRPQKRVKKGASQVVVEDVFVQVYNPVVKDKVADVHHTHNEKRVEYAGPRMMDQTPAIKVSHGKSSILEPDTIKVSTAL